MKMAYVSFEELEVWKKACQLSVNTYQLMESSRDYGLKDQMTRASVSIASNIAEGAERDSIKEFQRFIHIAKGSAAELRTQLYIATRIKAIISQQSAELIEQTRIIAAQLQTLALNLKPNSKPSHST